MEVQFVSRAGEKLKHALDVFKVGVDELVCADFGCNTGGFTDCLLQRGAVKVYSVDTGYGVIDWKLRNDPRVVVIERTNAMYVSFPEKADLISIDTGWTRQKNILPNALRNLKSDGLIITLVKPHYEADKKQLKKGKVKEEELQTVLEQVEDDIRNLGLEIVGKVQSPILGKKGGNVEFLYMITRSS